MLILLFYSVVIVSDNSVLQNKKSGNSQWSNKERDHVQILIGLSENELLLLFKAYLSSLRLRTETARNGQEVIDQFVSNEEKGLPYDFIILDTHLFNPSGLEVAKIIRAEKPVQKLVLVTTTPKEILQPECLKSAGILDKDILTMPFRMSKLGSVLKTNN